MKKFINAILAVALIALSTAVFAVELPWVAQGNVQVYSSADPAVFTFTAPASGKRNIAGTYASGAPQIARQWTIYDAAGNVVFTRNTIGFNVNVFVGPSVFVFGQVFILGLQPGAVYTLTVRNVNPSGSPSCNRSACNFFVASNNRT